jgi:hypothetical protein
MVNGRYATVGGAGRSGAIMLASARSLIDPLGGYVRLSDGGYLPLMPRV